MMTEQEHNNVQWRKVKLGDCCDKITDGCHLKPKCVSKSQFLMLSSQNIKDNKLDLSDVSYLTFDDFERENRRTNIKAGDVLLTIVGTVGRTYLVKENDINFTLQRSVAVLTPKDILDSSFLLYSLNNLQIVLENEAHGCAQKGIYLKQLNQLLISIPSLTVQRRIAAILASADKVIAATRKTIAKYKQMKQGMMEDLLKPKEGWKMVKLGEVGKISMCKRVFSFETSTEGEIPFYKIGTFGKTADAFISKQLYEEYKSKFSYPKLGDILISASGTIGRTVIYDGEPAYFQDSNIIWIDNEEQIVLNQFLYYLYQTITWNLEGSTIARLYNDNFNKIEISVPYKNDKPDLTEQRRIAAILSGIDAKIAAEEKVLEKYEKVKKGLMERLLEEE